jgi:hypothetical protein
MDAINDTPHLFFGYSIAGGFPPQYLGTPLTLSKSTEANFWNIIHF